MNRRLFDAAVMADEFAHKLIKGYMETVTQEEMIRVIVNLL